MKIEERVVYLADNSKKLNLFLDGMDNLIYATNGGTTAAAQDIIIIASI